MVHNPPTSAPSTTLSRSLQDKAASLLGVLRFLCTKLETCKIFKGLNCNVSSPCHPLLCMRRKGQSTPFHSTVSHIVTRTLTQLIPLVSQKTVSTAATYSPSTGVKGCPPAHTPARLGKRHLHFPQALPSRTHPNMSPTLCHDIPWTCFSLGLTQDQPHCLHKIKLRATYME